MNITVNTNLADQIIQVINDLAARFGIAVDWTAETVVPYLQMLANKLINYEIATSIVWMVLGVIFLAFGIYFINGVKKYHDEMDDDELVLLMALALVCIGIAVVVLMTQTFDIIKCITFPEKYIFDYIKLHSPRK